MSGGNGYCPRAGRILFRVLFWNTKARLAPRPIKELGELDRQLP
jgi:hypothetical protein